jgi:hypothetical protein
MEEEVRTTEEEMNRKATMEDVEAFAKYVGINKTGCTYDKFVQALIHMINSLMNVKLESKAVNFDCLKILVGEPMSTIEELKKVFTVHLETVSNMRSDYNSRRAQHRKERDDMETEITFLRKSEKLIRKEMFHNSLIAGIVMHGLENEESSDIRYILDASHWRTQETFDRILGEKKKKR